MLKNILKLKYFRLLFLCAIVTISCNKTTEKNDDDALKTASWDDISASAKGTTVNFMMWQGSPVINAYMNNYVIPQVKEKYNIDLQISGGQGPEIVQLVMGEKEAGITESQVDIVWVNGETSFQLRKVDGMWGPFVNQIPNSKYINFDDPYISTDFQQPIAGMESPWSIGQSAMVYDSAKVQHPPQNLDELKTYVKKYPGTFTISNDFSGMTELKAFLAELGGGPHSLDGNFDEAKYKKLSEQLWDFINTNKKYFWKNGETFPKEQTKMAQLFANGELYLGFGFSEGGIEEKVVSGLYPRTARSYPWQNGTIKNANYIGILKNAKNKAGAMQVIDFLTSPAAQFEKSKADGMDSNTILEVDRLPREWKQKFESAPHRKYGLEMEDLKDYAIAEPAPEYMIRLYEDFRKNVIEQ